jgi:hypothetical protein
MKLGLSIGINARAENLETMGGFEPADFGSLDIHYDISLQSGSHSDLVASVVNRGAGGNTYDIAQSTDANKPRLDTSSMGLKSLSFDNSNDRLDSGTAYVTTDQTFTFFAVFETGQAGTDVFFAGDVTTNLNFIQLAGANGVAIQTKFVGNTAGSNNAAVTTKIDGSQSAGTDGDIDYTYRVSTPEILIITRDASENIRFFNHTGGLMATSTSDATDSDTNFRFQRVGLAGTGGSPFDGNLGELGLYNKKLTDAQVLTLANYLAEKWNVS